MLQLLGTFFFFFYHDFTFGYLQFYVCPAYFSVFISNPCHSLKGLTQNMTFFILCNLASPHPCGVVICRECGLNLVACWLTVHCFFKMTWKCVWHSDWRCAWESIYWNQLDMICNAWLIGFRMVLVMNSSISTVHVVFVIVNISIL